jgi:hypothetical protein
MRTTIILDDQLGERLRAEARKRNQSFSAFLADAGRKALGESREQKQQPFTLLAYGEGGVTPGVDLNRTGSLLAAEDEEAYLT